MTYRDVKQRYELAVQSVTRSLRDLLTHRYSLSILGLISFVESALPVPIITDSFMVAYIIAHRSKVVLGVLVTTVTSVAGGVAAYLIARFFSEGILNLLSPETAAEFARLASTYADSVSLLGFLGAITPVPFTLAAVVAGILHGNVFAFIVGAFIGRIIRYGITGYLTYTFGHAALAIAERNIWPITLTAVGAALLYLLFGM